MVLHEHRGWTSLVESEDELSRKLWQILKNGGIDQIY